jgi:hypothetical protein
MGRPIKSKFFGNLNNEQYKNVGNNSGIGGEGIATITNPVQLGSFIVNSTATTVPSLVIPTPAIPTGTPATAQVVWEVESVTVSGNALLGHNYRTGTNATLTSLGGGVVVNLATIGAGQGEVQAINFATTTSNRGSFTTIPRVATTYQIVGSGGGNGDSNQQGLVKFRVKQINVLTAGTGYDSTLAITFNNSGVNGTGPGNPTYALSAIYQNAIEGVAYIPSGSSAVTYDIVKQEASHRYLVKTAQGIGQCKLAARVPQKGEMTIIATDYNGNTYYVTKLTARKALLTRKTQNGVNAWVYGVLDSQTSTYIDYARWTLGAAVGTDKTVGTTKVSIASA